MIRRFAIALALFFLGLSVILTPAVSQSPEKSEPSFPTPSAQPNKVTLVLQRKLAQPIDVRALQGEKAKFAAVLNLFAVKWKVDITLDEKAFAAAGFPHVYDTEVEMPPGAATLIMEVALRNILAQVANDGATFWIHPAGFIEIFLKKNALQQFLYAPSIIANYDQRPLFEVLNDLTKKTPVPIQLDPRCGRKSAAQISATFNSNTLEEAIVTVTEMAGLKYVLLERSIFVTTPENAKTIAQEEKARTAARESYLKSMDSNAESSK